MYLQQMHNEIMCWSTDQNVTTNSYEPHHELPLIAVAHNSVFDVSGCNLKTTMNETWLCMHPAKITLYSFPNIKLPKVCSLLCNEIKLTFEGEKKTLNAVKLRDAE